ncbi:CAAX prenyl protease 1 [Thraustotheca clavata]|uniref:Ste24 endopeptidase n=1 Tax=Thraustotheca clavata TaxID=74557 RepID=A0A1V9ZEY5_9STRA|nr:CAAX prenyl protease 1 [Thraustotheca clavata]
MELDSFVLILAGYMPFMWQLSGRILAHYGYEGEIPQSLMYVILTSIKDLVVQLPFDLYSTFVIEERHGFNKQTLRLFIMDKIKGILIGTAIMLPLLSALIGLIRWGGDNFVFYVWLLMLVFSIIMLTIVPVFIMPLFNKFTPLEEGSLKTRIETLASSLKFPLTKLFVCDGSKRSSHSNAYMYGFFNNKRIVIFDTLLNQVTDDEILAVLGHELGHWKMWHTMQSFIFQQVYIVAMFYTFSRCMHDKDLYASFGFSTSGDLSIMISLTLFTSTIWAPINKALSYLLTYNTRRNEFQADAFAVDLGFGDPLQSGLTKVSLENLANMNPDPLFSALHYSHPPLVERLPAISNRMKKSELSKDIVKIAEEYESTDNVLAAEPVTVQCSVPPRTAEPWRHRMHLIIYGKCKNRRFGMIYHYTILAIIVLDVASLMLETLDGPNHAGTSPDYPSFPSSHAYVGVEVVVTFVLTVDLVLKCVFATSYKVFYSFGAFLDLLCISSLYLLAFKYGNPLDIPEKYDTTIAMIKFLRCFRLIRIIFMMKGINGMIVLSKTLRASIPPLRVTFFFLLTFVMFFATMLFYAQPCYNAATCTFTDIFNAGYFVMVTVATVGYGDQIPDLYNLASILITMVVMIFGTLYLAMPLAIIGIHYETTWVDHDDVRVASGKLIQSTLEAEVATYQRMESTELPASLHNLNVRFLEMCDIVTHVSDLSGSFAASIDASKFLKGQTRKEMNDIMIKLTNSATQAAKLHRALSKIVKPFVPKDYVASSRKAASGSAGRTSSFSKSFVSRAKRALSNMKTQDDNDDNAPRTTLRQRLFLLLERPHSSKQANYVNKFFLAMVILSVLMFYAETTPELQHYGIDSDLCRDALSSYCSSNKNIYNIGCFVRNPNNQSTSEMLDFYCATTSTAPQCYGVGFNYGSNSSSLLCYEIFSDPAKICEIRQCKPGHVPSYDMTLKWVYLEYYFGIVFTAEMLLRLYASRDRARYLRTFGTYIDAIAVAPFYAELFQSYIQGHVPMYAIVPTFPTVLSILPIMKTLRILKLARHFKSTSVLARTARETWNRLLIPMFFLFLGCVSAGAIFYEIERGTACYVGIRCPWWNRELWTKELSANLPYEKMKQIQVNRFSIVTDMLRSSWLSIETFTTVGYGDMKPRTSFGRLFDILAMIFGSFYTAMPLSLVGTQFYLAYRDFLEKQRGQRLNGSLGSVRPRGEISFRKTHRKKMPALISQDDLPVLTQFMSMSRLLNEILQTTARLNSMQARPAALRPNEVPLPPILCSILRKAHNTAEAAQTATRSTRHSLSSETLSQPPRDPHFEAKVLHLDGLLKNVVTSASLCQTILLQFSIIVHKIIVQDHTILPADSPSRVLSSFNSKSEVSRRDSDSVDSSF